VGSTARGATPGSAPPPCARRLPAFSFLRPAFSFLRPRTAGRRPPNLRAAGAMRELTCVRAVTSTPVAARTGLPIGAVTRDAAAAVRTSALRRPAVGPPGGVRGVTSLRRVARAARFSFSQRAVERRANAIARAVMIRNPTASTVNHHMSAHPRTPPPEFRLPVVRSCVPTIPPTGSRSKEICSARVNRYETSGESEDDVGAEGAHGPGDDRQRPTVIRRRVPAGPWTWPGTPSRAVPRPLPRRPGPDAAAPLPRRGRGAAGERCGDGRPCDRRPRNYLVSLSTSRSTSSSTVPVFGRSRWAAWSASSVLVRPWYRSRALSRASLRSRRSAAAASRAF
jgi:hypothetical protein